jgi:photosystem II stability/assembly factor-like uncharacterized protein
MLMALALLAFAAPAAGAQTDERCFPETGQCISGRFRQFWEQNGGLAVFGYPTTPAHDEINRENGQSYLTQWFERVRFELHAEHAQPYDVLLGRIGDDRLRQLGRDWFSEGRESGPQPGCLWFEQTGHNVCDQGNLSGFKSYWSSHGLLDPQLNAFQRSLALFGLPLTTARPEVNPTDNQIYMTQWFERARFEWHPNEPEPYKVLLGLLGNEARAVALPVGGWAQVVGVPTDVHFNDVFMLNNDTALATGEQNGHGAVYRFERLGSQWHAYQMGSAEQPLRAIVALPDNNVWAVGDEGTILHTVPRAGLVPGASMPGVQLNTLQMFSNDEGWAAGSMPGADGQAAPVLLHYKNGAWQRDTSITGKGAITSLHFIPGEGWAIVNSPSETAIWHVRNGRWQKETLPDPCGDTLCLANLSSIHAAGAESVWAVGSRSGTCAICTSQIYAIHRVNGAWQAVLSGLSTLPNAPQNPGPPVASGFSDVYFADQQHGLAVGALNATPNQTLVARFHDGQWSYEQVPQLTGSPRAVSMTDANHAFVVGSNGLVLSYQQ